MDKRFVITDIDPNSSDFGKMLALSANAVATGIPLPAFRSVSAIPPAGTTVGEALIDTTTRQAVVWDGANWVPIVAGALLSYPTDADVIADVNQPTGAYATSQATGNLFVKGPTAWRQIGVRTYATVAGLLADANAPDGSLGLAEDEDTFWIMNGNKWQCQSVRPFPDLAAVKAWTPLNNGARALQKDLELTYRYHAGAWITDSILHDTEANINLLDGTRVIAGQFAIASDTGHPFVFDGNMWVGSQIRHYPTEADLLNDTPFDGIIAWGDDTGLVYTRSMGNWVRLNAPTVTVADIKPTNATAGDVNFAPTAGTSEIYDGAAWRAIGGNPVGTVIQHVSLTPPSGYLLCDGSPVPAGPQYAALRAMVGANLPDLRRQFVRGATSQNDIDGFTKHEDTTRRPRHSNLTGTAAQNGAHHHNMEFQLKGAGAGVEYYSRYNTGNPFGQATDTQGSHTHSVTITGGGDSETAPMHVYLAYHIKY